MGEATSTFDGDTAALRLFDAHRQLHLKLPPFSEMTCTEIEADMLENEILELCHCLSSTPIPKFNKL